MLHFFGPEDKACVAFWQCLVIFYLFVAFLSFWGVFTTFCGLQTELFVRKIKVSVVTFDVKNPHKFCSEIYLFIS